MNRPKTEAAKAFRVLRVWAEPDGERREVVAETDLASQAHALPALFSSRGIDPGVSFESRATASGTLIAVARPAAAL